MKCGILKIFITNIFVFFLLIVFLELYFSFKEYDGAIKHSLINCSSDCQKIKETYWKNYFQFLQYHYSYFSRGYDKNNELSSLSDGYFTLGVIRDIWGNKEKSNAVILAGCSFTHGSHLNDNETFSYFLSDYLNRSVYNWGICSGSPREMLYILQNKKLLSHLTENNSDIKYVIYTYLPDHLNRLLYDFYIVSPYYYPVNNYTMLKYKKRNPILNSLFFIKKIDNYVLGLKETRENNKKLFYLYMKEIKKEVSKNYKNAEFIIFVYQDNGEIDWELLKDDKIKIIKVTDIIEENINSTEYQRDEYDSHPNAKAWKLVVPALSKHLQ